MHLEPLWATDLENAMSFGTPMTTDQFIKAAKDRHIEISSCDLRALWRARALSPLVEVREKAFCEGVNASDYDEDEYLNQRGAFVAARNEGRLANAQLAGYRSGIRWNNAPTHWNLSLIHISEPTRPY